MLIVYVLFLVLVLLVPHTAYAWGPGMHLETALFALDNLGSIAPAVAAIIAEHPRHFIYGTVSPDILVGKRYAAYHWHCHNWNVAKVLLDSAKTNAEKAGAYGYLCHLAGDVVAHNNFVPYKTVRSYSARLLSHTYWEIRYDLQVPQRAWAEIGHILQGDYADFDDLMEQTLRKTILSFRASRLIFRGILKLEQLKHIQSTLRVYDRYSRWGISPPRVQHFYKLATQSVLDFLQNPTAAPCLNADPSGMARLAEALQLRNRMRDYRKRGLVTEAQTEQWVKLCAQVLDDSLFLPVIWWPDWSDVV